MPPKSGKSKSAIKSEINEKVREIRLRQEKWMRERDSSLKSSPTQKQSESQRSTVGAGTPKKEESSTIPKQPQFTANPADKTATGGELASKNSGFHNWLSNRKRSDSEAAEHLLDNVELRYSEEPQSLSVDVNDDVRKRPDGMPPLSLPATGRSNLTTAPTMHYDQLKVEHPESPLAMPAAQLDSLADEIVHRVKRELHLAARESNMDGRGTESGPSQVSVHGTDDMKNTPSIVSHHCPVCGKLMIAPRHRPLLLIPCGHTTCQTCLDLTTTYCSICSIHIQSTTPNIMLQQIINDYYKKDQGQSANQSTSSKSHGPADLPPGEQNVTARSRRLGGDQAKNHLGRTYSQLPQQPQQPPRKSAKDHEEEYRNLLLRCDILREEEEAICNKMAALDDEKAGELSQIDNISGAQDKMRAEIRDIEGRIEDLERHKEGYREKVTEIESLRNKERRKLEMVKTTVSQLKADIGKIKAELDTVTTW